MTIIGNLVPAWPYFFTRSDLWAHGKKNFLGYLVFNIPLVKYSSLERNALVEYQKRVECFGWYGVWWNFLSGRGRRVEQQQKIMSQNHLTTNYSLQCTLVRVYVAKNATKKRSYKAKVWSLLSRDDGIGKGIVLALDQDHPLPSSLSPKEFFHRMVLIRKVSLTQLVNRIIPGNNLINILSVFVNIWNPCDILPELSNKITYRSPGPKINARWWFVKVHSCRCLQPLLHSCNHLKALFLGPVYLFDIAHEIPLSDCIKFSILELNKK